MSRDVAAHRRSYFFPWIEDEQERQLEMWQLFHMVAGFLVQVGFWQLGFQVLKLLWRTATG